MDNRNYSRALLNYDGKVVKVYVVITSVIDRKSIKSWTWIS